MKNISIQIFQEGVDDVNSDFDLNSLIEGVVDDDSEAEIAAVTDGDRDGTAGDRHVTGGDRYVTAASAGRKLSSGKAKVVKYLEPLKVNFFYAHFHRYSKLTYSLFVYLPV